MNNVELMGRLVRDPKYNNGAVKLTLAIDRSRDKDGHKVTDFPSITVFGRQAENCNDYLTKGRQVVIQGRIQTGSYTDKNGKTVYTQEIVATRVEFTDGRGTQTDTANNKPEPEPERKPEPRQEQIEDFAAIDDEVPF